MPLNLAAFNAGVPKSPKPFGTQSLDRKAILKVLKTTEALNPDEIKAASGLQITMKLLKLRLYTMTKGGVVDKRYPKDASGKPGDVPYFLLTAKGVEAKKKYGV